MANRRQALPRAQHPVEVIGMDIASDEEPLDDDELLDDQEGIEEEQEEAAQEPEEEEEEEEAEEEEEEELEEEEMILEDYLPPGLKEISSLASWTVSTAKPGNGVAALRSSDLSHFWQSDGPQPHLLSIHFFKLVSIVAMRIYLDFASDESYTPTKIQFWAGMGVHDIMQFAEMQFESPQGWIDVDFSNVGPMAMATEGGDEEPDPWTPEYDWSRRPVLRAFLVQVKIVENHQNGKDTHLRSVQLFARDEPQPKQRALRRVNPSLKATAASSLPSRTKKSKWLHKESNNIKLASWMEPDLR